MGGSAGRFALLAFADGHNVHVELGARRKRIKVLYVDGTSLGGRHGEATDLSVRVTQQVPVRIIRFEHCFVRILQNVRLRVSRTIFEKDKDTLEQEKQCTGRLQVRSPRVFASVVMILCLFVGPPCKKTNKKAPSKSTRSDAVHLKENFENFHVELASQSILSYGGGVTLHGQKMKNAQNGLTIILVKFKQIEVSPPLGHLMWPGQLNMGKKIKNA